jgi:hypothetical protein
MQKAGGVFVVDKHLHILEWKKNTTNKTQTVYHDWRAPRRASSNSTTMIGFACSYHSPTTAIWWKQTNFA